MRALAVVGLVAACGNDPGLLLDVGPGSTKIASVEVFLPKDTAGDALGLPMATAKQPGTIYTVVDSVQATVDSSGRVRILLQPGQISDVPALLVLGYDASKTPVASAVVTDPSGSIHLPKTQAVELKVELVASTYVPPSAAAQPTDAVRIARWSPNQPGGDLTGACIAVLKSGNNAFFSAAGDLDCDAADPECDDTFYKYAGTGATPPTNPTCVSTTLFTQTMDACVVGSTIACTDGIGTCGKRSNLDPPLCVPDTVCKHCPNSDALDGTSGVDPACEMAARMDANTLRVDCTLAATIATSGGVQPCPTATPTTLDLQDYLGQGWGCAAPLGFFTTYRSNLPGALTTGGSATQPDYVISEHCPGGTSGIQLSYDALPLGQTGAVPSTDVFALMLFGVHAPTMTGAAAGIAVPFRLKYQVTGDTCPLQPLTCEITADSGDPKNDAIWHCAGR